LFSPSNLNESQRAVIAARLANMRRGEFHGNQYQHVVSANLQTPKISQEDAAELLNVSPRIIRTVKAVEREAPELVERKSEEIKGPIDPLISLEQAAELLRRTKNAPILSGRFAWWGSASLFLFGGFGGRRSRLIVFCVREQIADIARQVLAKSFQR
jgi:hypothetical protein